MFWNADGVRRSKVELSYYMTSRKIDIALISETHLSNTHKINFPGFEIYRKDRPIGPGNHAAGGVAILISRNIQHSEISLPTLTSIEAVAIETTIGGVKTVIAALYSKPRINLQKSDLDKIYGMAQNFIAAGDLNAKHNHWNSRICNQKGKDLLQHSSTRQYVVCAPFEPTYYPYDKRWLPDVLDVALIKNVAINYNLTVEVVMDSDHQPVTLELDMELRNAITRPIKNYSKADWRGFTYQLENKLGAPPPLNSHTEIDRNVQKLITAINTASEKHIPLKKPVTFRLKLPSDIIDLINEKNRVRKTWQRTGLRHHKTQLNQIQELVRLKIGEYKNKEWDTKVEELKTQDGSVWKMTKALLGNKITIPPLETNNGRMAYRPLDKANALADVLEEAFQPNEDPSDINHNATVQHFVQRALAKLPNDAPKMTTVEEIRTVVRKLKLKKAPGPDGIQNTVLRHLSNPVLEHLANIINSCFKQYYFPKAWKQAKILAFPKPGKPKANPKNYRPISLLDTLSKVMESILLARLLKFISNNDLLPNEQFGFRSKHSTNHALMRLVEDISKGFNNNQTTVAVFLDVEKAFDRVWHEGLIYKLIKMKFPDCYIKIIANYLSGRSFAVDVNSTLSTHRQIRAGVPQGSLIGPILYILYTHDFPRTIQTKFGCFADDTVIYAQSWAPKLALKRVQDNLTNLQDWLTKWRIKINSTKSEAIEFKRRRGTLDTKLTIFNSQIEWQDKVKYLGVILDKKLLWGAHVTSQVRKATVRLIQLYPVLNRASKLKISSGLTVYKALLRPVLLYAAPIWSCAAKTHKDKMQIFQNKVLRILAKKTKREIRITELHRRFNMDRINTQIKNMAEKFYATAEEAKNPLVQHLGQYDHSFRWKYKRPKMSLN